MISDLTVPEIFQAYYDCRKRKRNTAGALDFEIRLETNLMDLYYELINNEYKPSPSTMFVVTRPKIREIWSAQFRDRVVQHVFYNKFAQKFYNSFIFDSYACIPTKGTLNAANRVQTFMRSASRNHTVETWFLKADIANFFGSINKQILEELLLKKIHDPWWVNLTKIILHNDPTVNGIIKSRSELIKRVPRHKSLIHAPKGFGLPVGNLSSQFFANVYLNEIDQYAKHTLKLKYYVRYVDDISILGGCGSELHKKYQLLDEFAYRKLGLRFHPNKKEINKIDRGINFVGYIVKPFSKYIRRSTINSLYGKIQKFVSDDDAVSSVNSYFGMLRNANAYNERVKFSRLFSFGNSHFNGSLTKLSIRK